MKHDDLSQADQDALDAVAFRRLLAHLDSRKDVQNIDLMIMADFCRNCLSKWYRAAAQERDLDISDGEARARVYGMAYADWKAKHQTPASPDKLAAMENRKRG